MFENSNLPIFQQIAQRVASSILTGEYLPESRLPSVREYAAQVQVNPNTVMRSYEQLSADGIIYNRRGIGYFVCPDAVKLILDMRRESVLSTQLPEWFAQLQLLGVTPTDLAQRYQHFINNNPTQS